MGRFRIALLALVLSASAFGQKAESGTFKTTYEVKKELGYVLHSPKKSKDKKALIIFLHGSGERGTNREALSVHGPLNYIKTHELDAYILAPQCPENEVWDVETLYRLIQKTVKDNNIDDKRIYLTGLSMGGWGVWSMAQAHPELFAALVPIAGFTDAVPMIEDCKLAVVPTRIFHGLMDDVVDVSYAIAIYKKLKPCGGDIELTIFDDANHNSWSRVYDNPEIYDWMLKQKKP
jgi:predicted peptidase